MRPRPPDSSNGDEKADAFFTPVRFGAFLAVLVVVAYPQVVFGFETFFYRDYSCFGYPLAHHLRESLCRGELPLWNPLNNCGIPFLAQWNTLVLYPGSLVLVPFPLSWSLGVFNLAHAWFAGLGMFLLARRWSGNPLAGAMAGIAFAFSGLLDQALMWPNNIAALGWMPWVVLAVDRGMRDGGRWIIAAGLAGAMQMLTGAPEIILQTWLLTGLVTIVQTLRKQNSWNRMFLVVGGSVLLTAALAAAQLLPFLDLLSHSQRDVTYADSLWAMSVGGLANYLVPAFHCYQGPYGILSQPDQHWTASYYSGAAIVSLAIVACWRVRHWRTWVLLVSVILSLGIALGDNGPLYPLAKKLVPQLGYMRFPIKFTVLATFALPLLAAQAVSWLYDLPAHLRRDEELKLLGTGASVLLCMVLIVMHASSHPAASENPAFTLQNGFARGLFFGSILCCLVVSRRLPRFKLKLLLRVALLVLLWLDLSFHAPNMNPTVERPVYTAGNIREFFQWGSQLRAGGSRAMQSRSSMDKMMLQTSGEPSTEVTGRRLSLFADCNLLDDAPKTDGFYSLELRDMNGLTTRAFAGTNQPPAIMDLLGVSHASNPTNPVDWVTRDSPMAMITAGQQPVFLDDEAVLTKMLATSFDPRRTVYLPTTASRSVAASEFVAALVSSTNFSPHRLSAQIETPAPTMVVISQAYYHRWRAYVDDKPVPLWRADYAMQAVQVPAGSHRLSLHYEDRPFEIGAIISLATLLACAAGWGYLGRKPGRG